MAKVNIQEAVAEYHAEMHHHAAIGGAMMAFSTAIDDPIFYFGVHWHIDKVFDTFKSVQGLFGPIKKEKKLPKAFTDKELAQLRTAEELGIKISPVQRKIAQPLFK